MLSRWICVRPTSKRWFWKIVQVTMEHDPFDAMQESMQTVHPFGIHILTPLVPPSSLLVGCELGPTPPLPPMRVVEVQWSRALSLMCVKWPELTQPLAVCREWGAREQCSISRSSTPIKCHFWPSKKFFFQGALHKNVLCKVSTLHSEGLSKNGLSQNIAICKQKHSWTPILAFQLTLPNSNKSCDFDFAASTRH